MKHNPYHMNTNTDANTLSIHLEQVPGDMADRLQIKVQACGGDVLMLDGKESSVLLVATRKQLKSIFDELDRARDGLEHLGAEIKQIITQKECLSARTHLNCGDYTLPLSERTLVMGILNVTPDSFSDGGRYIDIDSAVAHARELVQAGADIIDVGGESTRPGADYVEIAEELDRVMPVIRALASECPVPISIDTYKSEVAEQAIQGGAHIINDIWGAKRDRRMAEVAARRGVPIILMHNRDNMDYTDFFSDMVRDLRESVEIALAAGVKTENIILDPGIGFAKTLEHNLETMRRLDDIVALGYPVLLATSRKSMIGRVLDLPPEERMEGTAATVALGVAKGCHMVRVHDVKEMKRVTQMMDAMLKGSMTLG